MSASFTPETSRLKPRAFPMGYQDRDYYQDEGGQLGFKLALPTTMVGRLILVNVIVFLVDFFVPGEGRNKHPVETLLAASPQTSFSYLYFWQFLTAGFVHSSERIVHILGNMIMLWFFGRDVEIRVGGREFLRLYLIMLTFSVFGFCLLQRLFLPEERWHGIIGASGAVAGLVVISVLRNPTAQLMIFGVLPMPAWLFGTLMVVGDMVGAGSVVNPNNPDGPRTAYMAHLLGAAFGFVYFRLHWNFGFLAAPARWLSLGSRLRRSPLRVHRPDNDEDADAPNLEREADQLLAKVHQQGEESLTARERKILEEYSRRLRGKRN